MLTLEVSKMLLTMTEAATLCNCSYSTIQKLVKNQKLPIVKRGRTYLVPSEALVSYINLFVAK